MVEGAGHTFSARFLHVFAYSNTTGDVFIFSGGCAHMAICLTTKEQPLSITCYEVRDCDVSVQLEII